MASTPEPSVDELNASLPAHVRISGPLAQGGQGIVYRGTVNGAQAAVKFYRPQQIEVRIEREIEALSRLDAPVIAKLLWSGDITLRTHPVRVVATSLIAGVPLNVLLQQRSLLPAELHALLFDVSEAILHLWSIRLVHRDLKPANIIIDRGRAVVIDLGVARHVDQASLTNTGATWGTVGYMSPEQSRGVKQLTCKSDLFALGVVALEAVMARHPTGRDQRRLTNGSLHEHLPCALPAESAAIVQRMLCPRPTQRPVPEAILNALSSFARGASS